jgi:CBS domain-containing protein
MLVSELLAAKSQPLITTSPHTPVMEAMEQLISHHISCLLVVNDQSKLVGIISDKDIFRLVYKFPGIFKEHTVWDIMTENVITVLPSDEVHQAAAIMTKHRIRHLPVVENDTLLGLVSIGDIVKSQLDHMENENQHLKKYISGDYPA